MTKKELRKALLQINNAESLLSLVMSATKDGTTEISSPAHSETTVTEAIAKAHHELETALAALAHFAY